MNLIDTASPCAEPPRPNGIFPSAAIIHDLGNLIQIASSAINIAARTPNMSPVHSAPLLDRAKSCLDQASVLVRQTLRRDQAVAPRRSGIIDCLADIRTLVVAMDEPGLRLELDVEPAIPDVRCDPIELRRALLNLVVNARDAMPDGGTIRIRARSRNPDTVELQVIDEGTGMSPETIARAFDPAFTTKSGGVGGIGLPMVERFVRDAGGEIAIASQQGVGTIVTIGMLAADPAFLSPDPEPNAEETDR